MFPYGNSVPWGRVCHLKRVEMVHHFHSRPSQPSAMIDLTLPWIPAARENAWRPITMVVRTHTHIHTYVIWFNDCCEKMTSSRWLTSELAYWALIALFNTRKPANVYGNWINETGWSRVARIQNRTWNQLAQPQVLELTSTKLREPQIERWTCWLWQSDTWNTETIWFCHLHYNDAD